MDKPSPDIDINTRVWQYVQLRDKIRELKQEIARHNEFLEVLGTVLLEHLNNTNAESVRTENGTFFKTVRKSASLEDAEAFMEYVKAHEMWDLMDRRANATAISDYLAKYKSLPPGVKYSEYVDVNVRRPT